MLLICFCGSYSHAVEPGIQPLHLTKCGILSAPSGAYVLDNDVTSPGTCFSVQADNVSLNLNGHTITYNAADQQYARYAIVGIFCWDPDLQPGPNGKAQGNLCGGTGFAGLTVHNGTITEGNGAAAKYSHCIRLGQNVRAGPTIYDMIFNFHSNSAVGVYVWGLLDEDSPVIYNNVFNNRVLLIMNRHQMDGVSIGIISCTTATHIYNNSINGGPQSGIRVDCPNAEIDHNTIRQGNPNGKQTSGVCDATLGCQYTNDFAILVWGKNSNVHENIVQPVEGRGIEFGNGSAGSIARHNKIEDAIELQNNAEYDGCEIGGSFGIQWDDQATRSKAHDNTVTVRAEMCEGQALRVTDSRTQSNISYNNVYSAHRVGKGVAVAIGCGIDGATGFTSRNDVFTADSFNVGFEWAGGKGLIFRNDRFVKGTNPASNYATFSFRNGSHLPVSDVHFIDSVFENGAAKDSTDMKPINSGGDWPGVNEYFIDWTYTFEAKDIEGRPLRGTTVAITDSQGEEVFRGVSEADGRISVVLTEFRMFNTITGVTKEMHTPHLIVVRNVGCKESSFQAKIDQTLFRTVQLECKPK